MDTSMLKFAKPELRTTTKRRKIRHELQTKRAVRERCVTRDGYCRIGKDADDYTDCAGPSEWCHYGMFRRARTRGMEPEDRHTTAGSFMACRAHHRDYDSGKLKITARDVVAGCDGELWIRENKR